MTTGPGARPSAPLEGVLGGSPLALAPAPAPAPDPEPAWLGGHWPLWAWVHRPAEPAARGAVVLCPPLLGEHAAAYHAYRALALGLADAGIGVVRFDYEGTGDSAGPVGGPGRLSAWLEGVDHAVEAARQVSGGPLALVGVRSGALIAAAAAGRRGDVDALVLWDPWSSGKLFLRRQRALHALRFSVSRPAAGDVEVPGFLVDAATAGELNGLRLPPRLRARRALVLARPGETVTPLPLALAAPGSAGATAEVERSAAGEQEALFEVDALLRRLPAATVATARRWLGTALADLSSPEPDGLRGACPPAALLPAERCPPPAGRSTMVALPPAEPGQARVYEGPVRLGPHGLFGIETRPGPVAEGSPVVVFLSSGQDPHVGPCRLWVTLARRWAPLGLRCVRLDLSGWGDSEPRPGCEALVLRHLEAFDDVADAVSALGGAANVVLVGLCSGAYQALDSALDLAPASPLGVLAVNPILRFTPPELVAARAVSARRRLCEPRPSWVARLRQVAPHPAVQAVVALRWLVRRISRASAVGSWLDELAGRGTHVYCVCGEEEARPLPTSASGPGVVPSPATGSDRPGTVRIEVVAGLDHALMPADQREAVIERLSAEVRRITGLATATAPVSAPLPRLGPLSLPTSAPAPRRGASR